MYAMAAVPNATTTTDLSDIFRSLDGGVTWLAASYLITLSGADREITEGVTALLAAAMLLYVGFWMHRHAHAARWKAFIETRVASALSGRTMWALGSISFLAVYREAFETVLFYQALLAGLLGLGFAFRRTTETIKSFMRGRFGGRDVSSEKANPDHR